MANATQSETAPACGGFPTREAIDEKLQAARRVVNIARETAEDVAAETAQTVRRHPLRAVGGAMATGAVIGAFAGLCAGWFMRPRPRRRWGL
jgi:hypothetical protein